MISNIKGSEFIVIAHSVCTSQRCASATLNTCHRVSRYSVFLPVVDTHVRYSTHNGNLEIVAIRKSVSAKNHCVGCYVSSLNTRPAARAILLQNCQYFICFISNYEKSEST